MNTSLLSSGPPRHFAASGGFALRALTVLAVILNCALPAAEPTRVWQIGAIDGRPAEFALGEKEEYSVFPKQFPEGVAFVVGRSDPARHFPYIHPGPMDVWAGSRAHAFTIAFDLPGEPAGTYLLLVALCRSHYAYPPTLAIEVGGEKCGDVVTERDGHRQEAYVILPATRLRAGENELRIVNPAGSWAVYDAIRLERYEPGVVVERLESLRLRDTPYLVEQAGTMRQVLRAQVQGLWDGKGKFTVKGPGGEQQVEAEAVRVGPKTYEFTIPQPEEKASYACELVTAGNTRLQAKVDVVRHRQWTIYAALKTHYDLGYTHPVDQMLSDAAGPMLDKIFEYCAATREFPADYRFRWTYPTWVLGKIRELMPAERQARFDAAITRGEIGWNAAPFTLHSYFCGVEDMVRAFYPAAELEKRYGRSVAWAKQTDVPGHTRFMPQVLARSGVRLLQIGANNGVRGVTAPLLFRWEGPDGSRVLTQLTDGYGWGFDEDRLVSLERDPTYPYDAFLALYVTGDNVGPADLVEVAKLAKRNSERYAYPRFRIGPVEEFVDAIEARFADKVPIVRTELTDWWIHGVASMAPEVAIARRARELLPTAEKMWSLASLAGGETAYPAKRFAEGYIQSLLFSEHTWGMAGFKPEPRPPSDRDLETNQSEGYRQMRRSWEVKGQEARAAGKIAEETSLEGLTALGTALGVRGQREPVILVFNPLNWNRSDLVRIPRSDLGPAGPVALRDAATRAVVPVQMDGSELVFLARDVPAVGYALYTVETGTASPAAAEESVSKGIENAQYRISFDEQAGSTQSIVDKQTGAELVDSKAPFHLGQYVYEGMDKAEGAGWHGSPWKGRGTGRVVPKIARTRIERGAVFTRFIGEGPLEIKDFPVEIGSVPRVVQSVTVPHELDWIACEVLLEGKRPTALVEQGNIAFPFGIKSGKTRLELLGSVVDPEVDLQTGGNRDCFAVQSWVDVSGPAGGVTWCPVDTTIVTLGDFRLFRWDAAYRPPNTHLYANSLNNGWSTNFREWQGGDFRFRFRLRSHRQSSWIEAAAPRFGRETAQPLLARAFLPAAARAGTQTGEPSRQPARGSLLRADADWTVLINLKRAEDGNGYILRFLNPSGKTDVVRVSFPGGALASAEAVLANERPLPKGATPLKVTEGGFQLPMGPFALETVRVRHVQPQR
ncbi:MAG TPA: polysaccharide lyase family protein [Verrucomicrobiae bacterium]